jgi:HIRAN domain-containing protein
MPKTFETQAVGLQYRVTASTRRMMQHNIEKNGAMEVMLIREHDNVHDENAIKVVIRSGPYAKMHIGYLPRNVASVYAPALDALKTRIREAHVTHIDADEGTAALRIVVGKFTATKKKTA